MIVSVINVSCLFCYTPVISTYNIYMFSKTTQVSKILWLNTKHYITLLNYNQNLQCKILLLLSRIVGQYVMFVWNTRNKYE